MPSGISRWVNFWPAATGAVAEAPFELPLAAGAGVLAACCWAGVVAGVLPLPEAAEPDAAGVDVAGADVLLPEPVSPPNRPVSDERFIQAA